MSQPNFPTVPLPSVPELPAEQQTEFELTNATVMFTDIEDSTGLAETLGLTGIACFLSQHVRLAQRVVQNNHGAVLGHTGDGILAVWLGVQSMHAHTAMQALAAAADFSREIAAANAKRRAAGKPYRRVRIGLHSGEVALEQRVNGAPPLLYGATVHQARKIEQAGKRVYADDRDVIVMASRATLLLAEVVTRVDENDYPEPPSYGRAEKCPGLTTKCQAPYLTDAVAGHQTNESKTRRIQREALLRNCRPKLIDPCSISYAHCN